jgi:hypothetical protein
LVEEAQFDSGPTIAALLGFHLASWYIVSVDKPEAGHVIDSLIVMVGAGAPAQGWILPDGTIILG